MIRVEVCEVLALPVHTGTCELEFAVDDKVVLRTPPLPIAASLCVVKQSFMLPRESKHALQVTMALCGPGLAPNTVLSSSVRQATLSSLCGAGGARRVPLTMPKQMGSRTSLQLRVEPLAASLDDLETPDMPQQVREVQYDRLLAMLDRRIAERGGLSSSQNVPQTMALSPPPLRASGPDMRDSSGDLVTATAPAEPEPSAEDLVTLRWQGLGRVEVCAMRVQPGAIVLPGTVLMEVCSYADAGPGDGNAQPGPTAALTYSASLQYGAFPHSDEPEDKALALKYGMPPGAAAGYSAGGDAPSDSAQYSAYGMEEQTGYSEVLDDEEGGAGTPAVDVSRYTRMPTSDGSSAAPLRVARVGAPLQRTVTPIVWDSTKPGIVTQLCCDLHHLLDSKAPLLTVDTSPRHHQLIYLRAADRAAGLSRMTAATFGMNDQFQRMTEDLARSIGSGTYLSDCAATLRTCKDLERVVRDFMETARTYGRVIISETHLPPEAKTIRPLGMGGVLGGEKYVVRGVMFKTPNAKAELFTRYGDTPYRDAAYIAHKVQGHEMKGLKAYFGWFFNRGTLGHVSFPLTAVIDFKGHRITAMTILPIDKNTLIYGSDNAGDQCTVKNEVPEWSKLIREASVGLRLKPHWVKNGAGEIELASCVDLEGHKARDGRMYLLDFSRTLPPAYKKPTTPPINDRCWPFYHMLRQEFVASYGVRTPLSADAWSTFASSSTPERKAEEKAINQDIKWWLSVLSLSVRVARPLTAAQTATEHLITVTAKEVAADLVSATSTSMSTSMSLSHVFHRAGLNMRYLGAVYTELKESLKETLKGQSRFNPALKNVLHSVQLEALVRVLKNYMRAQLRLTQENARGQDCEAELLRVTAQLLNNFFAYSVNKSAWHAKNPFLLPMLEQSFGLSGKDAERAVDTFFTDVGVDRFGTTSMETRSFKYEVLDRLNRAAGLGLNNLLMEDLRSSATNVRGRSFRRERLFDELMDITFTERVKHLDVVERSRALSCYLLGTQALAASPPQPLEAEEHFFAAFEVLRYSLSASPKDPWLCALMADTCGAIWALLMGKLSDSANADEMLETSKLVNLFADRAESYFTQALQIDGLSVFVLRRYGNFLQQRGQLDRAEDQLLKCLQIREHQEHALDEQAVRDLIRVLEAKKDLKRAAQLRKQLSRALGVPDVLPEPGTPPPGSPRAEDRSPSTPTQTRIGMRAPSARTAAAAAKAQPLPSESEASHEPARGAGRAALTTRAAAAPSVPEPEALGDSSELTSSGSKSPRKILKKLFSTSCV